MRKTGVGKRHLLRQLRQRLQGDWDFRSGRILGSMCTRPHGLAIKIFKKYIEKNIGDSGLVPATRELEEETISVLGRLLHNEAPGGYIVTGGNEANILAMWTARNRAGGAAREIIVPESAHFSFDKAADLLGLKLIKIPLDADYRMDLAAMKAAVSPATAAIVAVAGTTSLGMIDPIREIAAFACKRGIYLHVDAAFGGFVLPFLNSTAALNRTFDFALEGVCSITIDPHKMGLAPIPAGGILYRNKQLAETVKVNVSYLAGGETKQSTIVGTRSGAAVIAVWVMLRYLGTEGYTRIVRQCMQLTGFLAAEVRKIQGLDIVMEPVLNVVGIKTTGSLSAAELARQLRKRGWAVALFDRHIRICVMPHLRKRHLVIFLRELKLLAADLRRS